MILKSHNFLFFIFLQFSCTIVIAQQINFNKRYYDSGNHWATNFIQLQDSGYLIVGNYKYPTLPLRDYSFAMLLDKYGDSIWTKQYMNDGSIAGIVAINDSNFVLSGGFSNWPNGLAENIAQINWHGDTLFTKEYGNPFPGKSRFISKCSDGGYIQVNGSAYDFGIVKLDSTYNIQWHRYQQMWNRSSNIIPDSFGGFVSVGGGNNSVHNYEVERMDGNGDSLWHRQLGNRPSWDTDLHNARSIVIMSDSNFLIGCEGYDWHLMKLNYLTGDTMWTKTYDTLNLYWSVNFIDHAGNNQFICATNTYYMLLDENGDSLWTRRISDLGFSEIFAIRRTFDGGFAISGYEGIANSQSKLAFAKTDSLGNVLSTSIFNPENNFAPLTFYPNPARDEIFISAGSMAAEKNAVFTLSDMQGRTVLQQPYGNNGAIDISVIPAGLYIATLRGRERELRGKVMVER